MPPIDDWSAVELGVAVIGSVGVGKLLFYMLEALKDYWPSLSGLPAQVTCDVLAMLVTALVFWQIGVGDEPVSNIILGGLMAWFGIREVAKGEYLKVFDSDRVLTRAIRKMTRQGELVAEAVQETAPPETRGRHEAV